MTPITPAARLPFAGARGGCYGRGTMGRIGAGEIIVLALIALVLFGASRIADIGKGLGEGIRNFKKAIKDEDEPKQLTEKADEKKA